jgi:UDP-N-acetylmuramate--alanine ligase
MKKTVFCCGIGGSGMSGVARYFLSEGCNVFGSDAYDGKILKKLGKEGATVFVGQKVENIEEVAQELKKTGEQIDLFIYSEAIEVDNPEYEWAKDQGIEMKKYFEALGDISKDYYTIAVAGTHGKSSTASMLATVLRDLGKEVVSIVGANIHDWGGKNFLKANDGASDGMPTKRYFVVEACEYRDSFLNLDPNGIVVTNVEPEHLDYFGSEDKYFDAFQKFLAKLPQFGFFVSYLEGENIMNILPPNFHPRKVAAENYAGEVPTLKVEGGFQRINAASVLATAEAMKLDVDKTKESLENFSGLARRFDRKGEKDNILIIEDYAHHPTALKLSIQSARDLVKKNSRKKLWVVFQPHQYSRTAEFFDDFCRSFPEADEVLIPNIYEARDSDLAKASVSEESLVESIEEVMTKVERKRSNVWGRGTRKRGEVFYKKRVRYTENFDNTLEILREEAYEGDVVLVVGAGDVSEVADRFLEE